MDLNVVKKVPLHSTASDAEYWRSCSAEERLETVESIRREFHDWPEGKSGDEDLPRLQRVYRVRKLK